MKKNLLFIVFNLLLFSSYAKIIIIKNSGAKFSPEKSEINLGDTVKFELENNHNAIEVDQSTWDKNEASPKKDGFKTTLGGGYVLPNQLALGAHFFVCEPHASMQMKGVINVKSANCENFSVFIEKFQNNNTGDSSCSGSIITEIKGGVRPFNFLWNNGLKEKDIFNLCKGEYILEVTDANNCKTSITQFIAKDSVFENKCDNFKAFVENLKNDQPGDSICSGAMSIAVKGGTPPFNFLWNDSVTKNKREDLCFGMYIITVTDSNECKVNLEHYMKEDSIVDGNNCADFKVFIEKFQHDKAGDSLCTGFIVAQVKGGLPPFNFQWSNGIKEKDLFKLCEGNYSLSVADSKKCSTNIEQKIIADTVITLFPCEKFNADVDVINDLMGDSICTGALIAKMEGGKAPFKFKWSNGSELPVIKGLCKGEYKVLITDAENCSRIVVKQVGIDDIKNPCNGFYAKIYSVENSSNDSLKCNGALKTMMLGGKAPFDYTWNNGAKSSFVTNLCPGEYKVEIKDANNCFLKLEAKIEKDSIRDNCDGFYSKVFKLENDKSGDNICSGLISTETFGGTKPYSYTWNNGQTSASINDLCLGKYQVLIKDANNCEFKIERFIGSDSIINSCKNMFAFISESADNMENDAVCDGKLTAKAQGGTLPYLYNWSNGDSTATASNLCDDSYKVMIKDAKGCLITLCASVNKKPAKPTKLIAKIYTYDISSADTCDGIAKIAVTGGLEPYSYAHSNGNNTYAATQLCAGLYSVIIKDASNESLELKYLISAPANKHENDNLKDSTLLDTVKTTPKNECNLDYNSIDSVKIKDVKVYKNDTLGVTWVIYSGSEIFFISQSYCVNKGKGVYKLKLELYCDQNRNIGNYLSATENFYYGQDISPASIAKFKQSRFVVYPNPFETNCNIKMEKTDDYQVSIYDLTGKEVYYNNFRNSNFIQMDLSTLNKGVYILKLNGESTNISFKISK